MVSGKKLGDILLEGDVLTKRQLNKALAMQETGDDRKLGEILTGATTFRFDASDLMPGAIGAGTYWTGMVDYTNGKSAQDVADAIQDSWDAIK